MTSAALAQLDGSAICERRGGGVGEYAAAAADLNMGMLRYLSAPRPVNTMPRKEIDSGDVCTQINQHRNGHRGV